MEIEQLTKIDTCNRDFYNTSNIPKRQLIQGQFILTTKRGGSIKRRFVTRGDMQKLYTYNKDSLTNTVYRQALMASLSYVLDNEKLITQLDISSTYLYAELEEELYARSLPHMDKRGK